MFDVPPSTSVNKSTSESTNRSMTQTPINEKRRNYRFYAGDPAIHPADKRLYANGDFEGTPLHVSGGSDPRSINRTDRPYHDLPVPKFKLDRCWVGVIPAKEVTFRNLNDNITKIFLTDQCKRFGEIDDCRIYYDRQTKKHLGLGTVIFKSTKAARECVNALNMTTKMGSVISVSLETSGQERTKQYATIIRAQEQEKAAQEKALAASFAASPPPQPPPSSSSANDLNHHSSKQSDRSHLSSNHKITNNNNNNSRTSKNSSSSSNRYDHRNNNNHHHHSTNDNNSEQFSFDPYGSFGINSKNSKPSRRSHHRSHHHHHRRDSQPKYRRKRKPSTSTTSSPSSRSSRSSSSSSSTTTSSHSSSTSRSYSRSSRSSSRSSRSSYSPTHSPNRKLTNDSRIKSNDDEDQRPSLDERIAALFQQNQTNNSSSSSIPSKGHHHKQIPLPNIPPPPSTHYPYPPQTPSALTNVVGSHHHHQQSYGVVNTFNFYGTSFPSASFLTSTGVTNWEDIFKQPPPSSSSTTITTTTTKTTINNNSTNGFRLYPNDSFDERQRKSNELTTTVTNVISNELIEILRKDLAKKLIETLVYKSIETWYDNEERKDKIRKIKSVENSTNEQMNSNEQSNTLHHSLSNSSIDKTADDIPSNQIATPQTAPPSLSTSSTNLSTYFEHMRDRTGSSVTTHIPKIPTFKKRPAPDEKPNPPPPPSSSSSSQKPTVSIEKKEPEKSQQQRKISRKRLSSSSSESNITPENDDSQSRDSVSVPNEDISSSETKANNNKTISIDQPTPEEEEGEIKDDDETEDKSHPSEPVNLEPPSPPSEPIVKKTSTKTANKQTKKPGPPKKRKIEQIKSEPIQDQDDIDNSTLAKRKKSAINLHQASIINELNTEQSTETVNLLDNLSQQTHSSPKTSYNPYAYIEFEHDYAIMTKQPVPVAKRLTVDGLHDMGVQIPIIMQPKPKFPPREHDVEMKIMYEIDQGIDEEDMSYLKQSFQKLCEAGHSCTTKTRWVDHPPTRDLPFVKQPVEKHRTGCARTEGYYKIVKDEKIPLLKTADGSQNLSTLPQAMLDATRTTGAQMSRELRSEHRRNLLALGDAEFADHFKFSQLKLRKKRLRYAKSSIHAWGLFACEPIAMEDMVIEYVGETIRQSVGDLREKQYELEGINSNYMFRVDSDTIVDATKCGNLARFINHSCDPNCYAKIIPVESQKKIVIYSKRDIRLGEEITYDYKFPLEEQKIPCRCGTPTCRGSLN